MPTGVPENLPEHKCSGFKYFDSFKPMQVYSQYSGLYRVGNRYRQLMPQCNLKRGYL